MRLSWKAGRAAGQISHAMEVDMRRIARERAINQGREFADEQDVKWAYQQLVISMASDFTKPERVEIPGEFYSR